MAPSEPPAVCVSDAIVSPTPTSVIFNPYSSSNKKPSQQSQFVGGAEEARHNARMKAATTGATRIWRPGEQKTKESEELPKSMNIYDRFFGALLRSTPTEFQKAASSEMVSEQLWHSICRRLGLSHMIPQQPIASCYTDTRVHFGLRATLVLEEAREAVTASLTERWNNHGRNNYSKHRSIPMSLHYSEEKSRHTGLEVIHFRKLSPLSRDELFHVRPGNLFECVPRDRPNLSQVVLGVVATGNNDEVDNKKVISLFVIGSFYGIEREDWLVTPLCTLISELRQYEACTRLWNENNLPFLRSILGGPSSTHVRFESDEETENNVKTKKDLVFYDDDEIQVVTPPRHEMKNSVKMKKKMMPDDVGDDVQVVAPPGHEMKNSVKMKKGMMSDDDGDDDVQVVAPPGHEMKNSVKMKKEMMPDDDDDDDVQVVAPPGHEMKNSVKMKTEMISDDDDDDVQVVAPPGHDYEKAFTVPHLNKTQERAASTFLNSAPSTVTIIQGPPGTGKTTLLISIICRYLLESTNKKAIRPRLLVCAPTNKAITVLATRFLHATNDTSAFNTILVGDADKLLADERNAKDSTRTTAKLRSIFVYQWIPAVLDEYLVIRRFVDGNQFNRSATITAQDVYDKANKLHQRLTKSLPGLPQDMLANAKSIGDSLVEWSTYHPASMTEAIVKKIDRMVAELRALKPEIIYKELVASAHVLFSTLASAGGMIVKTTIPVHDLIVDEAAAATEPDLYIPFHLSPRRLLVVGDPRQLPATVLSRRAVQLGLSKSLHERLMYDCKYEHIMLDVQYRMRPDISTFPSHRFYHGKVNNGDNVRSPKYKGQLQVLDGRPYTFLQVDGIEKQISTGSYQNPAEAFVVVQLIKELRESSERNPSVQSSWHGSERLRVITFYTAQAALLRTMCHDAFGPHIVVATVDSSQGCEADIVIVSFVRSKNNGVASCVNHAGFLTDDRRMNVALTRAKYQLICVGNARGMADMLGAPELTLKMLATDAKERGCIRLQPSPVGKRQTSLDEHAMNIKRERFH